MKQQEEDLLPAQQKTTRRKRSPIWVVCFQLLVVLTCCIYILLAAFIYQKIDPKLGEEHFTDVILFCFTTIATIVEMSVTSKPPAGTRTTWIHPNYTPSFGTGYGNMHPSNAPSMLFTIAYSLLGIPLFMFTLGSLAKSMTRGFWLIANSFGEESSTKPVKVDRLPLPALVFMFVVMLWITALLFQNAGYYRGIVIEDIYFWLVEIVIYISLGMMLLGIWFTIVREYLKKSRIVRGKAQRGKHFLHATSQNITPQSIHLYDFECLSQNEFERH